MKTPELFHVKHFTEVYMAAKKRKTAAQRKRQKRRRRIAALLVLAVMASAVLSVYIASRIVHVEYVNAKIAGLPAFLDGTRILFVSDLKLSDQKDAHSAAKLMKKLSQTEPDIVIFGGDFTDEKATDIFRVLTEEGQEQVNKRLRDARRTFLIEISPLFPGAKKYAVAGDEDAQIGYLYEDLMLSEIKLIENAVETVPVGVSSFLTLVGYGDYLTGGGTNFKYKTMYPDETVIVLTHNPDAYPLIASVTDETGHPVADFVLAGHTLGGQFNLFGRNFFSGYEGVYESGYYNEAGPGMLVSEGVGANWLPFRLGSRAEASLITLERK